MTAPVLTHKKFWIVKPKAGRNYIKNPRFDPPDGVEDWVTNNAAVTIELSGNEARRNAYSMKVNPVSGTSSSARYDNVSVISGLTYTFSVDVKGVAGQAMRIRITDTTAIQKAVTTFTATGYWQRVETSFTATETKADYKLWVTRDAVASTSPFYVDGAQFEQESHATTFIDGYGGEGYSWDGAARNSDSLRAFDCKTGGELLDLDDYCQLVQVTGLGHGDWNQIVTKMTSGGDMYQGHIRKSRQFGLVVDFTGDTLGEIEANRKAIIDAIRPDLFEGEMVVRYQGFSDNGDEATNPVDIRCVPLPATMTDTPDLPNYQRAILNFGIPSGLLQGAYDEGHELELHAEFPAEFIVRRDPQGNWCEWDGAAYVNPLAGINSHVTDIKEAPNGDIYVCGPFTSAGGIANTKGIARWSKANQAWEAVGDPNTGATITWIRCMAFDANGDLYVGGDFTNLAGIAEADYFAKYVFSSNTWEAVGSGINDVVRAIEISPQGTIYIGGSFASASGNASCIRLAYWNGIVWDDFCTWGSGAYGLVSAMKFCPNGHLIIGGNFTDAKDTGGDYICYWDGVNTALKSFEDLGATGLNNAVATIDISPDGTIIIGGAFTNAGNDPDANYVAEWRGNNWGALSAGGVNDTVSKVYCADNGDVYLGGFFTQAGSLSLTDRVVKIVQGAFQPLEINLPGAAIIYAICLASDGSLYLGGVFSTVAGNPDENAVTGMVVQNLELTSASANTYPFIQVHGPGTLRSITNYSTGANVGFDALTLLAGEYINLEFDPTNLVFWSSWRGRGSLLRYVNAGSDYGNFYLRPGINYISLFMTDTTADTHAFMSYKPQFWGIDGALL